MWAHIITLKAKALFGMERTANSDVSSRASKLLSAKAVSEEFVFEMDNPMNVDFDIALKSRVLEATLTDMVLEMISEGGALHGMIKEPDNGYHWYHHEDSEEPRGCSHPQRRI